MAGNIETIGCYNVRKLPNGMYSVCLNNGNIGAYMCDEAGVNKLREKYCPSTDMYVPSSSASNNSGDSKMTYEEAKKIYLFGSGKWGMDAVRLHEQAEQVMIDHEVNAIKDRFKTCLNWSPEWLTGSMCHFFK